MLKRQSPENVQSQVEILIKSFIRFEKLRSLVRSVRKHYPDILISIADDSPPSDERDESLAYLRQSERCQIYELPFHVGLSAGRNYLLKKVTHPFFVILDDDTEFTQSTDLTRLYRVLNAEPRAVIAAGNFINFGKDEAPYHGRLKKIGKYFLPLQYGVKAPQVELGGVNCVPCRFTHNFFMGKTALFTEYHLHWDEQLKIREHLWFFWNVPKELKIFYVPGVSVNHHPTWSEDRPQDQIYRSFRRDPKELFQFDRTYAIKIHQPPFEIYRKDFSLTWGLKFIFLQVSLWLRSRSPWFKIEA